MIDGKRLNRSLVAGMWAPCFARRILSCAALTLQHTTLWQQRVGGSCTGFEEELEQQDPVFLQTD